MYQVANLIICRFGKVGDVLQNWRIKDQARRKRDGAE